MKPITQPEDPLGHEKKHECCYQHQGEVRLGFSDDFRASSQNKIWFCISLRKLCHICLLTPMLGLMFCVAIAVIFQFEHIQETRCKVYNIVPSISAVTGISPGRYIWRISIAFHLGPRLLVLSGYYHYLLSFFEDFVSSLKVCQMKSHHNSTLNGEVGGQQKAGSSVAASETLKVGCSKLLKILYYLQIIEIVALCGISFIHNRENYQIHEKSFLFYLFSSHGTFLVILRLYGKFFWSFLSREQRDSYYKKMSAFCFSITCMAIMFYFYYRHFFHCDDLAFSIFAFVEYFVAASNMYLYWTITHEMTDEKIIIVKPRFDKSQAEVAKVYKVNFKSPNNNGHFVALDNEKRKED